VLAINSFDFKTTQKIQLLIIARTNEGPIVGNQPFSMVAEHGPWCLAFPSGCILALPENKKILGRSHTQILGNGHGLHKENFQKTLT
jgi:hypothetical protein